MMPGPQELVIILIIVVLLFGATKIPELAKGLGLGLKEFKKASKETEKEIRSVEKETEKKSGDSTDG